MKASIVSRWDRTPPTRELRLPRCVRNHGIQSEASSTTAAAIPTNSGHPRRVSLIPGENLTSRERRRGTGSAPAEEGTIICSSPWTARAPRHCPVEGSTRWPSAAMPRASPRPASARCGWSSPCATRTSTACTTRYSAPWRGTSGTSRPSPTCGSPARAAAIPLRPELFEVYDAEETPRAERGELPYLRCAEARDYLARGPRARRRGRRAGRPLRPRGPAERRRLRLGDAGRARAPAQRDHAADPADRGARHAAPRARAPAGRAARAGARRRRHRGRRNLRIGRRPARPASPTTTSARATRSTCPPSRSTARPSPTATTASSWPTAATSGASCGPRRAGAWRRSAGVERPGYWTHDGRTRAFDRVAELRPELPVMHVSCHEAEAYARWCGRRLPTEAEWEKAASWDPATDEKRTWPWGEAPASPERATLDQRPLGPAPAGALPAGASAYGALGMIGDVWEWTASDFGPYPGFRAFPYREYSETHFGKGYRVAAGRLVGHAPGRRALDVPLLGPPGAPPDLRRVSLRRLVSVLAGPDIRIDSLLDETSLEAMADDVRAGLRGRPEGAAAEVLLRRARVRALRPDHRAARVLPHPLRAGHPEPSRAGPGRALGGTRAGRARLGLRVQDARPALRHGGRREARPLRAGRRLGGGGRSARPPSSSSSTPACACTGSSGTSSTTWTTCRGVRSGCSRCSAARSATTTRRRARRCSDTCARGSERGTR